MKHKQTLAAVLLTAALTAGTAVWQVSAADAVQVTVTIADAAGSLALAAETVSVTDTDGDGALTIHDALYLAHEQYYTEGAAGYGSAQTDYGLSLTKLWGAEGGSGFGYYRNDASAMSLADPVADGDRISAFVYTDTVNWSDTYCFFDVQTAEVSAGDSLTLTLSAAGYDANWNPVTLPVANAVLTVNGTETAFVTDEKGEVTLSFAEAGEQIISAVSHDRILVPPCCKVTVQGDAVTVTTAAPPTETGDSLPAAWASLSAAAAVLALLHITRRKTK
ncbi:MAG: hypothetical protein IJC75_04595 [Oscillospiraceae bacterium]|nr:hypothetical protein [Oscillospiraceae bacterium]